MRKKRLLLGIPGVLLVFAFFLTACSNPSGGGGSGSDTAVTAFSLDGKVTKPVRSATPNTTAINETQYTGTVAWQTSDGTAHTGAFAASTVYKAVVTLTAKAGWTFTGVAENKFTYSGATAIANAANNGTVTITFPATTAEGSPDTVTDFSLDGKVTKPVKNTAPDTAAIDEAQYTGTVAWQTSDGTAHTGAFAPSTVYKAVLTLTANAAWTFTGVAENSFTYTGAAVANAADSGTVTITFPATTAAGEPDPVNAFSLTDKVTAPVKGATPDTTGINEAQYTGAVAWQTADGTAHTGAFAPSTVYKAVLTLTPKTGWTFTGVAENRFTYSGATAIANAADSGTVTITFPATAAEGSSDTVVNAFSLDGKVIAPVKGATPNTTGINETQYTGAVAWQTADGTAHTGAFTPSTVYKAVVTLAPKTGWTFEGVVANSFTYSGATSTANTAGSGIVTITFPATAAAGDPDPVNAFVLDGKVTASVAGAIPVTTAINETQYTGTVAWQTADGTAHTNAFAASTVYKAVLTLAAKTGWTFAGVAANSFTYTGATATNAANSGIVTITFPVTAADEPDPNTDIPIGGNPSVKLYLDGSSTALAHNGSTTVGSAGTGTYTVSVDSGYSSVVWYLNGTAQTQFTGGTIILSKRAAGNYLVTVEAVSSNGTKNSGAHTFVVK